MQPPKIGFSKKKSTILPTKYSAFGGEYRDRTGDLLHAMQALSRTVSKHTPTRKCGDRLNIALIRSIHQKGSQLHPASRNHAPPTRQFYHPIFKCVNAAIILMVDSNLQREHILPSERAFAYKMKLDAIKNQGTRSDLTSTQVVSKLRSNEKLGAENNQSRETVRRFIRLTNLIPELLDMDSQIFLGGSEPTTLKDLAEALGKETIDSYNNSDTRGNSPSYGTNYQKLGHELMSRDELAVLDGGKCILQLRGVRPFLSDKYDLTQHPNYKLTSDANPKNALDIEKYLSHKEKIHSDDQFVLVDVDSLPPA